MMCWFFTGPSTFLVDQSTEAGRGLRCFLWRLEKDKEIEFREKEEEELPSSSLAAEASSSASVA